VLVPLVQSIAYVSGIVNTATATSQWLYSQCRRHWYVAHMSLYYVSVYVPVNFHIYVLGFPFFCLTSHIGDVIDFTCI